MNNNGFDILTNGPLQRIEEMLIGAFNEMIDFCTHYFFVLLALASIAKIIIGILSGRGAGFISVLIAIISSAMAIAAGVFFW